MAIGQRGRALIKDAEGLRLKAYQDSAGVWTIGWGSTHLVTPGLVIDLPEAEDRFDQDVAAADATITQLITAPMTEAMRDALGSWVFNLGYKRLLISTLRKRLNTQDYAAVPAELRKWVYAKDPATGQPVKLDGLVTRREKEAQLFLEDGLPS